MRARAICAENWTRCWRADKGRRSSANAISATTNTSTASGLPPGRHVPVVSGAAVKGPPVALATSVDDARPEAGGGAPRGFGEARPMVWLTGVEGVARILSFGFYLLAARVFEPQDFGVVQYTITVAMLAFGGLQVLATAIVRELGVDRADEARTRAVLGSSIAAAVVLWGATSLLWLIAASAGLGGGTDTLGLLAVLAGTAAFQVYYSIGRGLGDKRRQAASYVGASLAQLIAFGALAALTNPTTTQALLIFGGSSFVPVVIYEWISPVLRGWPLTVSRDVLRRLWLLGAPLLIAQVGYLLWNSLDQLWVHGSLGSYSVGIYASAKNLSQGLIIVPAGITGVLLPRVAQLSSEGRSAAARRVVILGTAGAAGVSAILALMLVVLRVPLLTDLFGSPYAGASDALVAQACGMVCYAAFASLTMAAVGWGRPRVYTAGIAVAAALEAAGFVIFGCRSLLTAGVMYSASIALALVFVLGLLRLRPLWGANG